VETTTSGTGLFRAHETHSRAARAKKTRILDRLSIGAAPIFVLSILLQATALFNATDPFENPEDPMIMRAPVSDIILAP
jgi:hypothetical protein